jgi:hypothetical protein
MEGARLSHDIRAEKGRRDSVTQAHERATTDGRCSMGIRACHRYTSSRQSFKVKVRDNTTSRKTIALHCFHRCQQQRRINVSYTRMRPTAEGTGGEDRWCRHDNTNHQAEPDYVWKLEDHMLGRLQHARAQGATSLLPSDDRLRSRRSLECTLDCTRSHAKNLTRDDAQLP